MSQTPNPHDPYGTEPGGSQPQQPTGQTPADAPLSPAPHGDVPSGDVPAPTSDPALHPHDPYAYDSGSQPSPQAASEPRGPQASEQSAYGQGAPGDAGQGSYSPAGPGPEVHGQGAPYGAAPAGGPYPGGPHDSGDLATPPPGIKGVFEGQLTGEPMQDSDVRMWAMLSHLAALLQFVIPFLGGLIAQIVLFVVFKDRSRFLRYNAAEALNGAIAALILSLLMGALFTIITIVTLGLGAFLFSLMFLPQLLQAIFAIIGAVKANQGIWWNYPINLRLIK